MKPQEITSLRLQNQWIANPLGSVTEVVRSMGAMQAQDYHGALWSIGLRTGLSRQDIIKTIEAGKIIRTWPQRGTLHFVPAEDAKWLVGLSAARLLKGAATRRERLGLDDKTLAACRKILTKALNGGQLLSRPEIINLLENNAVSTKAGRGYHILWYLSQTGLIYVGPMRDKQQTFGLLDELVPRPVKMSRQSGIAEMARRYFISHGPATLQDFMWWTGLTSADARAGLEANRAVLDCKSFSSKDYWLARQSLTTNDLAQAFLLPGFDEYMLGYKDRAAALPAENAAKIVPGGNGMFLPTIVINDQVIGTWQRAIKKDHVQINLTPFEKLAKTDLKLLQTPAENYGRFLDLPVKIKS